MTKEILSMLQMLMDRNGMDGFRGDVVCERESTYLNYTTYVLVKRRPMHVFIDKPSRFYLQWSQWRRPVHVFIDKPSKFYLVKSRLKCSLRGYLTR